MGLDLNSQGRIQNDAGFLLNPLPASPWQVEEQTQNKTCVGLHSQSCIQKSQNETGVDLHSQGRIQK